MHPKHRKWAQRLLLLAVALFALLGAAYVSLGFRTLSFEGDLQTWPETMAVYDALLRETVTSTGIDYQALRSIRTEDGHSIENVAAYFSDHGPRTTPGEFATDDARLAYAINAYNVFVLAAVVRLEPEMSIHEIHGLVDVEPGFGFFYGLQFELDGTKTNLYDFEHEVIRGFGDPRVHAAINCASRSCPHLRSTGFRALDLDAQLDQVTTSFVLDSRHVNVDEENHRVSVSAIFVWYQNDFAPESAGPALNDVLPFIQTHGVVFARPLAEYEVVEIPYDWALATPE